MKNRTLEKTQLLGEDREQQNKPGKSILAQLERLREFEISSARASERLLRFEELDGTKTLIVNEDINEPLTHELESEEFATNEEIEMDEIIEYDNLYETLREFEEMRENDISLESDLDKDWDDMDY